MSSLVDYAKRQGHESARVRGEACAVPNCFKRPPMGFDYCSWHHGLGYVGAALLFVGAGICLVLAGALIWEGVIG